MFGVQFDLQLLYTSEFKCVFYMQRLIGKHEKKHVRGHPMSQAYCDFRFTVQHMLKSYIMNPV